MTDHCQNLPPCSPECPLEPAHARLREAHHHWHSALEAYQIPDLFRIALNACIQSLRNSTFALQKCGAREPDFKAWYSNEQSSMKSDATLRWLVTSRNRVVKEEDLALQSIARAWPTFDYRQVPFPVLLSARYESGEGEAVTGASPSYFDPLKQARQIGMELIDRGGIPLSTVSRGIFTVERIWVDKELPHQELLAALGHCFGHICGVLERAHPIFGVRRILGVIRDSDTDTATEIPEDASPFSELHPTLDLSTHNGPSPVPCMSHTGSHRSQSFNLLTGEPLNSKTSFKVEYSETLREQGRARYGRHEELSEHDIATVEGHARHLLERARTILAAGDDHATMLFLYRAGYLVDTRILQIASPSDKLRISREILESTLRLGATRVGFIAESWVAPIESTPDGAFIPPSMHPERREALTVSVCDADGTSAGYRLTFTSHGEPPNRQVNIENEEQDAQVFGMVGAAVAAMRQGTSPRKPGSSFFRKRPPDTRENFLY